MRVCLIYDCLYPHTIGGAERWYRALATALVAAGHDVTYVTRRQWEAGEAPDAPAGVRVVAVSPFDPLYDDTGRRRIDTAVRFGRGVLGHLLRHGRDYDVVHTASFPYFSLLAAGTTRPTGGFGLIVDWHEVWTRAYWREYLGAKGDAGWSVQRACVAIPHSAFCFSHLHAQRLRDEGFDGSVEVLEGEYAGDAEPPATPIEPQPTVVYAGRHIAEKRVPALVDAIAAARRQAPELRGELLGDGPELPLVERRVRELGLEDAVALRGFVDSDAVDETLRHALCLVLPSRREGYGLVVVESLARGTPAVVVRDPDNAATELIEEGVNGFVARSAAPDDLAEAILAVRAGGERLRASTADWYRANAERLSLASSLQRVVARYADVASAQS